MGSKVILFILAVGIVWYYISRNRRYNRIYADAQALKKNAKASGGFHKSPYTIRRDFLNYMGQFFKYKKHEWVFIAFSGNRSIDQFWINKGYDSEGVSPYLDISEVKKVCIENCYNHVLVGHNHPGGTLSPSALDRDYLEEYRDTLADSNISAEHLVFVAGDWRKYGLSISQFARRLINFPK